MGSYDPAHEGARQVVELDASVDLGGEVEEVDMITLDSLGLENVSLIKADAGFYEYAVFEGAQETIQRCRPFIIFEHPVHKTPRERIPEDVAASATNTKDLLESYGYTIIPMIEDCHNFLALPNEKKEQLVGRLMQLPYPF